MGNPHLNLVAPAIEKRTVMPRRAKNATLRTREYLTRNEVEALMAAARQNRYGHRDATMILIAFRHGLRASEAVDLRWDQIDFTRAVLHVRRTKGGTPSVHPLSGSEMRALRRLQREDDTSPFVFVSERGAPFTTAGFARMMERAASAVQHRPQGPPAHATARLRLRSSQLPGTTLARCELISGAGISSTRCATPSWRPTASGNFRQTECDYKSPDT